MSTELTVPTSSLILYNDLQNTQQELQILYDELIKKPRGVLKYVEKTTDGTITGNTWKTILTATVDIKEENRIIRVTACLPRGAQFDSMLLNQSSSGGNKVGQYTISTDNKVPIAKILRNGKQIVRSNNVSGGGGATSDTSPYNISASRHNYMILVRNEENLPIGQHKYILKMRTEQLHNTSATLRVTESGTETSPIYMVIEDMGSTA